MSTFGQYTYEDYAIIRNAMERNQKNFIKTIFFTILVLVLLLFVPMEILSIFRRRGRGLRDHNLSGSLYNDLGAVNVVFYILIPLAVIFTLLYFYVFKIPKMKKDFAETEKEIDLVRVNRIEALSKRDIKELMELGLIVDHKIIFESNNFGLSEEMFLSHDEPHRLNTSVYKVEVTKNARIVLKKGIAG